MIWRHTVLLLLAFLTLALSQSVNIAGNIITSNTCQPLTFGACTPCTNGTHTSYYTYYLSGSYVYGYQWSDSLCSRYVNYANGYEESNCQATLNFYPACSALYYVTGVTYLSLDLQSQSDISVSFIGSNVMSSLSATHITANGDLTGLRIHNAVQTFRFEQQVSPTQYSTNLGVFTFGDSVNVDQFTFSVVTGSAEGPFESDFYAVGFTPMTAMRVINDNEYKVLYDARYADLVVFTDSEYDLSGIQVSNPFVVFKNLTFYPAFQEQSWQHGNLVFQVNSREDYFTYPCYYGSSLGGDAYMCEFSSFSVSFGSFSLSSWHGSFSLDETHPRAQVEPDHMAFSLF